MTCRAIEQEHSATYIIFAVFAIALELWLASFSWRLVAKIARLTDEERELHDRILDSDYSFWHGPTVVRLVEYNTATPAYQYQPSPPPREVVTAPYTAQTYPGQMYLSMPPV